MNEKYYTVKEVADLLGVCKVTIFRRIRAGEIKKTELSKRNFRITEYDLRNYLNNCQSCCMSCADKDA